jgi:hypothetical protein
MTTSEPILIGPLLPTTTGRKGRKTQQKQNEAIGRLVRTLADQGFDFVYAQGLAFPDSMREW